VKVGLTFYVRSARVGLLKADAKLPSAIGHYATLPMEKHLEQTESTLL
jgi:hypothetical protein